MSIQTRAYTLTYTPSRPLIYIHIYIVYAHTHTHTHTYIYIYLYIYIYVIQIHDITDVATKSIYISIYKKTVLMLN